MIQLPRPDQIKEERESERARERESEMQTERQRFIDYMITRVLDLYLEGKVPLPSADVIAVRVAHLCEQYNIPNPMR